MELSHSVTDFEFQIDTIISIVKSSRDISSFSIILQKLKDKGLNCVILKKQRGGRKRINFDDAYILGVLAPDKSWIAVKIHPDKYDNCKRIYNDTVSMSGLIDSGDIAHIYSTFVHNNTRVVIYKWSRDSTVEYVINKYPDRAKDLESAIQKRIASLTSKGWTPDALGYSDMIAHPNGSITITDVNKIKQSSSEETLDSAVLPLLIQDSEGDRGIVLDLLSWARNRIRQLVHKDTKKDNIKL